MTGLNSGVKIKPMKIVVDKQKCIGCGTCVAIALQSFKLADDGKAEPIDPAGDSDEKVRNAVASCPVAAITTE